MSVIETNSQSFPEDVLNVKDIPVLVDFWAPWCGPCQMQGPILEAVANEAGSKARIVKVNVDESSDLAGQYGIMSIPALKVFKNGALVEEMTGLHQKEQLLEMIERNA